MSAKKAGRKAGQSKMPGLMPQTLAMLAPQAGEPDSNFALMVFPSAEVEPNLARLVFDIRYTRAQLEKTPKGKKQERNTLKKIAADKEARFGRASEVAAAVGDAAFFIHAAKCFKEINKHLEKRREVVEYPLRQLIRIAKRYHGFRKCTAAELKAHLAELTAATFTHDEMYNDLRAMGLLKKPRK